MTREDQSQKALHWTSIIRYLSKVTGTKVLLALAVLVLSGPASAACSGSGLVWSCTSGSTSAQVQTAVNSSPDNSVITFANGTYAISGVNLNNRNGITLICATVGGCTITGSGDAFSNDSCSADKTNLIRISGFVFTSPPGSGKIWLYCNSILQQVRIDHNSFSWPGGNAEIAILFGELSATGKIYGVVDHNTFTGTNNYMAMKNISGGTTWVNGLQASSSCMYFEDNTLTFTNDPDLGSGGIDVWRANCTVARFNTFSNSRIVNHSYCHEGPASFEGYFNTISSPSASPPNYRAIHMQGSGEEMIFGNTVEINSGGDTIIVQHFRGDNTAPDHPATTEGNCNSASDGTRVGTGADSSHANDGNRSPLGTYAGYPSWHQPGRNGTAVMKPVYSFLNKNAAGTRIDLVINSCTGGAPCYTPKELIENRDFYNAVSATAQTSATSPFNGTVGVGFGTLARRPTTCTPTSEALDAGHGGVGYWATDQGSWNSSGNGVGSGVLYSCTASNTWTVAYTPFTYPHPLAGGSTAPSVSFSSSSLTFAGQLVGTSSASQAVTLSNIGTASLNISSISLTGTNSGDFSQNNNCPSVLAVGLNCTINVTFLPTTAGSRTANVSVTDDAAGSPQTVGLTGTGVAPTPTAVLSAASIPFGNQTVGVTSASQTISLSNTGTATLAIASIVVNGDFARTTTCGATLGVGLSCNISVTFTPTVAGLRNGTLTVTDNSGGVAGSTQTASLSGTGISVFKTYALGRVGSGRSFAFGRQGGMVPDFMASLPQQWVNSGTTTGDGICSAPGGVYAVDKTLGIDFTADISGLGAAATEWLGNPDQWYRIKVPAGTNIHSSSYNSDNSLISMPKKVGATKCLVIESTTPLPNNRIVCSHGLPGYGGVRNPGCTTDIAKMWKLTADSTPSAGNNNINWPFGSNHIVVRDVELAPAIGSAQSASGAKSNIVAELNGDHIGLERSYIHGYNPGDVGQPAGACSSWTKSGTVNTSGTTVTWVSGKRFGMDLSDGVHSSGYPQATITINGVSYTVTDHDPTVSDTVFTIGTSAGTQTAVAYSFSNPKTIYANGCGDDNRGVQINCDHCWLAYNYIEKIHWWNGESHAISSGFSSGPVKVVHNWVEAGAAGFFSGGGAANSRGGPTSDFEIRGNNFMRDLNWRFLSGGASQSPSPPFGCGPFDNNAAHDTCPMTWGIKNNIEFKTGARFLIDGNMLDGVWADGQSGYLMLLTVKSDGGGYDPTTGLPLAKLQDGRISNNWFRNGPQMIQLISRSLGHGNGNGVSNPLQRLDFLNNIFTNVGDSEQWGNPGNDIMQIPASNQTYIATLSRSSGVAHAVAQPIRLTNYASASGTSPSAFDFNSISSVGDVVTADLGEDLGPRIGGTITIANAPGWNGTFTITGVKFGSVTTPCTKGIHLVDVSDPTFAVAPQPCIVTTGINAGTFGDTVIYTDNINHPGTNTLCSSIATCTALAIQASLDSHWFRITDIPVGDGVFIRNCAGGTNPTAFQVGSVSLVPAIPPTNPAGLDVYYANPGADDSSGTTCLMENGNGHPDGFTFLNNTVLSQKILSLGFAPGPNAQFHNHHMQHNVFGMPSGNNAVLTCNSVGTQGTVLNGPGSCADQNTFQYNDNIMALRTLGQWPPIPATATPNVTPATVGCSGATADTTCLGFTGYMSGVTFPLSACTYDGTSTLNCPMMAAPWSSNFSLSKLVPVATSPFFTEGANIPAMEDAFTRTKYVCPVGANCGTGPYSD